ncbi:MAG TPA: hypothetical protein VFY71_01960 [Planctomycetota bacterium]|nr:hypothetical protein [Planctomycetota bacterium]
MGDWPMLWLRRMTSSRRAATGLVALASLAVACDSQAPEEVNGAQQTPWCAVETGLPGNRGDHGQVALRKQPASGLTVLRQPLGVTQVDYRDGSGFQAMSRVPLTAAASQLADGSWLVEISGDGPAFESTTTLLQLDASAGAVRLLSAHLSWSVDVPPLHAWAALSGGWVHLDDSELRDKQLLRVNFRLEGEVVGAHGPGPSGPRMIWSEGHFPLTLKEGSSPPVPDELRTWFEGLAARR